MARELSNLERIQITMDAFNERDWSMADDYVHEDLEWMEMPSGNVYRGRDGLHKEYESWLRAFPDGKVTVTNMIDAGDWVIAEYTLTGTHTGPMHGKDGEEIPPTGRAIEIKACDLMRVVDGRVVGGRGYFDSGALDRDAV